MNNRFLLAVVHYSVPALDRSAGRAADPVARCVISPAGVAVPRAAPGATQVVGPHGVLGGVFHIDSIRGVTGAALLFGRTYLWESAVDLCRSPGRRCVLAVAC